MPLTAADVREYKAEAQRLLARFDIDDEFVVKVKKNLRDPQFLGQYRSFSQFRGLPIFWINAQLPEIVEEAIRENLWDPTLTVAEAFVDTILHEYGHVIWEYARTRDTALFTDLNTVADDDEEEFAETFAVVVKNNAVSPAYRAIITRYMAALRES